MSFVSIKDLTVEFDLDGQAVEALGPIHLEIEAGEFICVLGESGCGKSTLLRVLAGLQQPTSGEVSINGHVLDGPSHERGVVFQRPNLLPWLSVRKNIALGYQVRGERIPRQTVDDIIETVGLTDFDKMRPTKLSGGMAQRAAIARALVYSPQLLLLDEPFSALDALTRLRMQRELLHICEQKNLTAFFVTHDIDEAIALGSRIVVMTRRPGKIGRIIQVPLEHPRSRRGRDFIRLQGLLAEELSELIEPTIES